MHSESEPFVFENNPSLNMIQRQKLSTCRVWFLATWNTGIASSWLLLSLLLMLTFPEQTNRGQLFFAYFFALIGFLLFFRSIFFLVIAFFLCLHGKIAQGKITKILKDLPEGKQARFLVFEYEFMKEQQIIRGKARKVVKISTPLPKENSPILILYWNQYGREVL